MNHTTNVPNIRNTAVCMMMTEVLTEPVLYRTSTVAAQEQHKRECGFHNVMYRIFSRLKCICCARLAGVLHAVISLVFNWLGDGQLEAMITFCTCNEIL